MDAPANVDDKWREIEDELIVAGMNLLILRSSSSIDELLVYLVRVERVLARVDQDPPMSIKKALLPSMTAPITDNLSKKITERITAGSSTVEKGEVENTNMPSDSSQGIIGKREMVNARIIVWWPMDKTFCIGTVEAYDPLTKKHKIKYEDYEDEEALNLRKEKWELINEKQPRQMQSSQKQEADIPSPPKEPVKNDKKITKRKAG